MKLTDKIVSALPTPPRGNRITYDKAVPGFGCRVTAAGGRSFILNYRRRSDGTERRWTIGSCDSWTTSAAREEAKRLKRLIDGGGDPVGEHRADRSAPTINDLCDRFESDHLPRTRPSTQHDYRTMITREIRPALGKMKVAAVTFSDVDRLHRRITQRAPFVANRTLAVLSAMFGLAAKLQWRESNPVKGVARNQEPPRARYLSADELARLLEALAMHPERQFADICLLLLLTGARLNEVLGAKWGQFDLRAGTWTKPHTNTKTKKLHHVPLSGPAQQLLADIYRAAGAPQPDAFVFPGRKPGAHRVDVSNAWPQVCRAAKIRGLRIHDLRHSFASIAVSGGSSLAITGKLLGHAQASTTQRYAHIEATAERAVAEFVGAAITRAGQK
jgi:integrase